MSIEWMVIVLLIAIALVLCGLVVAKTLEEMGGDDREPEESKPVGLWQGHERRKVRAGSHHD